MKRLGLGVIGLGRAFTLMRPTFAMHSSVDLVAAADPRVEATQRFAAEFGGKTYATCDALCDDPDVEAVYIASPHQDHVHHACRAARAGKHVLVEKPMALSLEECDAMIEATEKAGVRLVVGHSHSFDAPIARARAIIESGELGSVRMVTALNFTDFLYRPRRPEELDTSKGGGVFFSQAAHQVDILRLLVGSRVTSVRASSGAWDPKRPTEGAYAAHLTFENGAFATLTYNGYGGFDSDELCGGFGELGHRKDFGAYSTARRNFSDIGSAAAEASAKNARNYGGGEEVELKHPAAHQHFGLVVVSCDKGDIRPMPDAVHVFGNGEARIDRLNPPGVPRAEVVEEFIAAIAGKPPVHDGRWGRSTLEVCLAMLASAREKREVLIP